MHESFWKCTLTNEPPTVRLCFLALTMMADKNGMVEESVEQIAEAASLSIGEVMESLARLEAAADRGDPGVVMVDGGIRLANCPWVVNRDRKQYMREYMRKRRGDDGGDEAIDRLADAIVDLFEDSGVGGLRSAPRAPDRSLDVSNSLAGLANILANIQDGVANILANSRSAVPQRSRRAKARRNSEQIPGLFDDQEAELEPGVKDAQQPSIISTSLFQDSIYREKEESIPGRYIGGKKIEGGVGGGRERGEKRRGSLTASLTPPPEKIDPWSIDSFEIPDGFDTDAFRSALGDWLEHRKLRKLPAYKTSRWIDRIAKWGYRQAIAAIEFSIAQNYNGVYEEKGWAGKTGGKARVSAVELKRTKEQDEHIGGFGIFVDTDEGFYDEDGSD